jgi:hypothetical protein
MVVWWDIGTVLLRAFIAVSTSMAALLRISMPVAASFV